MKSRDLSQNEKKNKTLSTMSKFYASFSLDSIYILKFSSSEKSTKAELYIRVFWGFLEPPEERTFSWRTKGKIACI